MKRILQYKAGLILLLLTCVFANAQVVTKGVVMDAATKEALAGATVSVPGNTVQTATDNSGAFQLVTPGKPDSITISYTGYQPMTIEAGKENLLVALTPSFTSLNMVFISTNRDVQKRSEAPVSLQAVSLTTIKETKATRLDMLVNKIPGAFMTDLGNEQHSMSIRQPINYSNLFLYLQDGIPIRTIGDFNHNALIEINQASVQRIEMIKGPASSLYGSEAVGGVVNFITQAPSVIPTAHIQAEAGSLGYRRTDVSLSNTFKKFGIYLGGYYVNQDQAENLHNDFKKGAFTLRADYTFSPAAKLVTTADYINYKTDQKGGLDSAHFYDKNYESNYRFTYRKVNAFRIKSTLSQQWNDVQHTSFTLLYRNTAIGQNPFYRVTNISGNPAKAKGEVNEDAFSSYGTVIQHNIKLVKLKGKWISGVSVDFSPARYDARHIDVNRVNGIYTDYTETDSLLTRYDVDLLNTAVYTQLEITPVRYVKLVAALRYDRMDYTFDNHLPPGSYTGAPDASSHFDHVTPKIGATWNISRDAGLYVNYSVGFAPPNISDLFRGVQVPVLKPATFNNYETGGWYAFARNKAVAEFSIYRMDGVNEIVSTRLPDGTYQNQSAGKTRHSGIEASIKYEVLNGLVARAGGTVARHTYQDYVWQGKDYSGNTMSQAPGWIGNGEVTFKPSFIKGLRMAVEWQGMGSYYTDAANSAKYKGFHVFNARMGYTFKGVECWVNCLNVGNVVYASTVDKSAWGASYRPGQLRTFNVGVGYTFNKK